MPIESSAAHAGTSTRTRAESPQELQVSSHVSAGGIAVETSAGPVIRIRAPGGYDETFTAEDEAESAIGEAQVVYPAAPILRLP